MLDPYRHRFLAPGVAALLGSCAGDVYSPTFLIVEPGEPVPAELEPVWEETVETAVTTHDGAVILAQGDRLWVTQQTLAPQPLGVGPGAPFVMLPRPSDVLIGGKRGLFVFTNGGLELSPVSALLAQPRITSLAQSSDGTWIVTAGHIHRWAESGLQSIDLGLSNVGEIRAVGRDDGGVWLSAHGRLLSVQIRNDAAHVQELATSGPVSDLASNSDGNLWVRIDRGDGTHALQQRTQTGAWIEWRWEEPIDVTKVIADPASPDLWILSTRGLWYQRAELFRPVVGVGELADAHPERSGAALLQLREALARIRPQVGITLNGVDDDTYVSAPHPFTVEMSFPTQVDAVKVTLGGVAQYYDPGTHRAVLNPWSVSAGDAELRVAVQYANRPDPIGAVVTLHVQPMPPPTFSDVRALARTHCDRCHGQGASAHPLVTLTDWRKDFANVLETVTERRMPLPPNPVLSGEELVLLTGWRDGGFLP